MLSLSARFAFCAGWLLPGLLCAILAAAEPTPATAQVTVRSVRFAVVREAGGWYEAVAELAVKPLAGPGRFVDRVSVVLALAYEPGDRRVPLVFHRAEVEAVTLPAGRAMVRYYLPPEVVARDRLRGEPAHYLVEIRVAGEAPVTAAVSASLRVPDFLRSFQARIDEAARENDGVLVPQFRTPFAHDPQRPTPTFVRNRSN